MEKENDEGNIEYKWKLVNPTNERIEKLKTQMKFRLNEGKGECFYYIGVMDDGTLEGITQKELFDTIDTIRNISKDFSQIVYINEKEVKKNKYIGKILIRENIRENNNYINIRIAVCGSVDASKSTTIGVLTRGILDNGRGLARSHVFIHKHEVETGRTSSISTQILGFNSDGNIINYEKGRQLEPHEISKNSFKIITFSDLAGHEKYLHTTVSGITGSYPEYAMLVIGSNMGFSKMTKEHTGVITTLKIPFFIILSKIDICPKNILQETLQSINNVLKLPIVNKIPLIIRNENDILTYTENIIKSQTSRFCPIFLTSNVIN